MLSFPRKVVTPAKAGAGIQTHGYEVLLEPLKLME